MALRARRRWSAEQQISAAKVVSGRCAMWAMRLSYGMETRRAGIWGNHLGGTDAMRNRPAVPPASGANVRLIRTLPRAGPAVRPATKRGIRPCEACRERITIMTGAGLLRHVQHAGRLRELGARRRPAALGELITATREAIHRPAIALGLGAVYQTTGWPS
jgi:hypothetical protein